MTAWVRGMAPESRWAAAETLGNEATETVASDDKVDESTPPFATIVAPGDMDVLSDQTLFRPERTETVDSEEVEIDTDPVDEPAKPDLELIGMASIHGKAAALIRVRTPAVTRRIPLSRAVRSGGRSRGSSRRSTRTITERTQATEKSGMYRVGQRVEDTGYVVRRISFDDDSVLLTRSGDDPLILRMESDDDGSSSRQKETLAEKEKEKEKAAASTVAKAKPTTVRAPAGGPPGLPFGGGPPPVPGTRETSTASSGTAANAGTPSRSPEELKAAAMEARRMFLERRNSVKSASTTAVNAAKDSE